MTLSVKDRALRLLAQQSWLRGRDRVLRAFSNPDSRQSAPFEVDFFGMRYSGDLNNFIDWTVFYYGCMARHELELLAALAGTLRGRGRRVDFFDVGANIGHHSLFMSRHADRVFSFEPFDVVREEMLRKMRHAGVENMTVFPVALGDTNAELPFHPPTGANQGTGTLGECLPDNASGEIINVQVVRGDDFFRANELPAVSLLKMDVEGFETQALRGLRETLLRDRPPILLEIQSAAGGKSASGEVRVQDLLYPDHLLFTVSNNRGRFRLRPYSEAARAEEEALVLPRELASLVQGETILQAARPAGPKG
jgi:FkbM family methyltransferase